MVPPGRSDRPFAPIHPRPPPTAHVVALGRRRTARARLVAPDVLMALKVNWSFPIDGDEGHQTPKVPFSPVDPAPGPHRSRRVGPPNGSHSASDRDHAVTRATDALITVLPRLALA